MSSSVEPPQSEDLRKEWEELQRLEREIREQEEAEKKERRRQELEKKKREAEEKERLENERRLEEERRAEEEKRKKHEQRMEEMRKKKVTFTTWPNQLILTVMGRRRRSDARLSNSPENRKNIAKPKRRRSVVKNNVLRLCAERRCEFALK
jgi:hypothetical protein